MRRFHKSSSYRVTLNYAFGQVIEGYANDRKEDTWIVHDVVDTYHRLHELGHAHSIEVWRHNELADGIYDVAQDTLLYDELMFSRQENASETALLVFYAEFIRRGGKLVDCRILNSHTASLGAVKTPHREYLEHLSRLRQQRLPSHL